MELHFHDIFPQRFVISNTQRYHAFLVSSRVLPYKQSFTMSIFGAFETEGTWYSDPQEAFSSPTCDLVIFCSFDVIGDATLNYRQDGLKV